VHLGGSTPPVGLNGARQMKRRQLLLGSGATLGGASILGTGAFTSVSANRSMDVSVAADSNAFLALEAGDSGLVTGTDDGMLEINLDGSAEAADGSGVNMDARTAIGSVADGTYDRPADIEENHAFEIRNQGSQTYETLSLTYELEDASWLDDEDFSRWPPETSCSLLKFIPSGQHPTSAHYDLKAPHPIDNSDDTFYNGVYSQDEALYAGYSGQILSPGESVYVSILVDTTGETADMQDKLSGTLTIGASDPV